MRICVTSSNERRISFALFLGRVCRAAYTLFPPPGTEQKKPGQLCSWKTPRSSARIARRIRPWASSTPRKPFSEGERRSERFRRVAVMLAATESSRGAGQSRQRPCGVTPAWPLFLGPVSARNQQLHVNLNPKGQSPSWSRTSRRVSPNTPEAWAVLQHGENVVAEPSKQEIDARAYQLWEQAGGPEGRESEFWHLAEQELRNKDKGSPTRTPDTL
jgi:hypothetical protein